VLALDVGVEGVEVGVEGVEESLDVGWLDGAEEGADDGAADGAEEPPRFRLSSGVPLGVGVDGAGAAAASLFTVGVLVVGAGLNTCCVVVPSQDSGFHQVAVEVGAGVLAGAAAGLELALLTGLAVGTLGGATLAGVEVPVGGDEGFGVEPVGCGVDGAEVGCGVAGVLALDFGVLGVELGAEVGAVFAAALFATAAEPAGQAFVDGVLAAFATVGITATPVAASITAGSPIAVTMRARLVAATSTRRSASAASSGVGTTTRGLFTPPLRERSGAWSASDSGSGPASSANVPTAVAEPSRARRSASSTAARWSRGLAAADGAPCSGSEVLSFPLLLAVALKT
jgi:hypothetical protein